MLRWLGAVLILSGGLLTRQTLLEGERAIQRTRRELAGAFESMEAEIHALLTPLPVLLRRGYGESVEGFFGAVSARLDHGASLAKAWEEELHQLTLSENDIESIQNLGRNLNGGEENVRAALRLTAASLRRDFERDEGRRREREKLITSICVCISLLFAVLLF